MIQFKSGIYFVIFWLIFEVAESHLRLVPRDSVVRTGVNVTLECSTSPSLFVNWEFTSFDSGGTIDVSAGPIVFNPSKYGLETDTEDGNFYLIVRSVTAVDAGRYTCIDDGGLGDRYSAELTVIGSKPFCDTNMSGDGALGENTCNLEQDDITFTCRMAFHGNLAPVLEWRDANANDVITTRDSHLTSTNVTSYSFIVRAEYALQGTSFVCRVRDFPEHFYTCSTPVINILYLFNTSKVNRFEADEQICSANTSSLDCSYLWGNTLVEGPVLNRQDLGSSEHIICTATCHIRGRQCKSTPLIVELSKTESVTPIYFAAFVAMVLLFTLLMAITILLLTIYRRRRSNICGGALGDENPLLEKETTSFIGTSDDTNHDLAQTIEANLDRLLNFLDIDNGLADCLLSKGVLTLNEHGRLTDKHLWGAYQDQNLELLTKILIPKRVPLNKFLDALNETGQKHVAYILSGTKTNYNQTILNERELRFLEVNFFQLTEMIKPTGSFLRYLVDGGCINERHKIRIESSVGRIEKNRELLNILRRRSRADFDTFKRSLFETKQVAAWELLQSTALLMMLPIELLEEILTRATLNLLETLWEDGNLKKQITSGFEGYRSFTRYIMPMVFIQLTSICSDWKMIISRRRRGLRNKLLKHKFVRQINRATCRETLIDRIDMQHGLLDRMVELKAISTEEKGGLEKPDQSLEAMKFTEYPEKDWDRLRSELQINIWNKGLLKFLRKKDHSTFEKFLQSLQDTSQTHLINFMLGSGENLPAFSNIWPIQPVYRYRLIVHGHLLRTTMNPSIEVGNKPEYRPGESSRNQEKIPNRKRKRIRNKIRELGISRHDKTIPVELVTSKNLFDILLEKIPIGKLKRIQNKIRELGISRHDRTIPVERDKSKNLFDILLDRHCITSDHKIVIDRLHTQNKNKRLLDLLKTGSIHTYEVTVDYFKTSDQQKIANLLQPAGKAPEELMIGKIEIGNGSWIEGIVCLRNRIYVVTWKSGHVYTFSSESPFSSLPDEDFEIPALKYPWDMVAFQELHVLFISDTQWDTDGSLLKVQLPGKHVQKFALDGRPEKLSVGSKNQLLILVKKVVMKHGKEIESWNLGFYDVKSVSCQKNISLPPEIKHPWHAVQTSNETIVVLYESRKQPWLIGEMSANGEMIRTLDLKSANPDLELDWPQHLAIDEKNRIFMADYNREEVIMVDPELTKAKIVFDSESTGLIGPIRLCYIREKQQLIVGQVGQFSIFKTSELSLQTMDSEPPSENLVKE